MRFETAYEVSSSKNRRLRKERKKTLREVAAAICVPLTTYREWNMVEQFVANT